MNGKDGECSLICQEIPDDRPPTCGNGEIDITDEYRETCENCPEDVQRCITWCGNGIVDSALGEECDNGSENGKDGKCTLNCRIPSLCGNGIIDK